MNNKIKLGYFSFSRLRDAAPYLEWHQLDHFPEQFAIPGLPWGQRFVAPPSCMAASAARDDDVGLADSLQLYFMEDDAARVLEEFLALGRELAGAGRMRTMESRLQAPLQLVNNYAAPRILISAEAVPYRPNHGAYVVVEHVDDVASVDDWLQAQHRDAVPELLDVPGVAGMWSFASTGAYGLPRTRQRASVVYLDDDPVAVAGRLDPFLARRWKGAPVHPMLAGPFRSLYPPPESWDVMSEP
jgi:hypothetical protein